MNVLRDWFESSTAPKVQVSDTATQRTPDEKVDFHISRFERALAQCEKGPERKAELKANLDYWRAIKAARELRGGRS